MIDSICNWFHCAHIALVRLTDEQFRIAVLYEMFRRGKTPFDELGQLLENEEYKTMLAYRSYMLDAQRRGQIDSGEKRYI